MARTTAAGNTCRAFVVDDGSILFSGLFQALSDSNSIEVVGTEHDNWRLLELVRRITPDVVIVPLAGDGVLSLIPQVRDAAGEPVAVLVVGEPGPLVADSIVAGASGTISWRATASDVSLAVMAAVEGNDELPTELGDHLSWSLRRANNETIRLSNREMEVMQRATEGLTNSSIARSLSLSEATVKTYWRRIFKKLDAHDRTTAVTIAMTRGIFPRAYDAVHGSRH